MRLSDDALNTLAEIEQEAADGFGFTPDDAAEEFITSLAIKNGPLSGVRGAIASLVDDADGKGGRNVEKVAIIAKAWGMVMSGDKKPSKDKLKLDYGEDANGNAVHHLGKV